MVTPSTMEDRSFARKNTFIIDFANIPRQIRDAEIVAFLENELQMTHEHVLSLQPKRNRIFVETPSLDIAQDYVEIHDAKHVINVEDYDYVVRLTMEDGGVNVKVRDLPPQWNNDIVMNILKPYGQVLSIKDDVWDVGMVKGVKNGTRTARMVIQKPIPSYLRAMNELAFVSYPNQQHTCKSCQQPIHPSKKCSEVMQNKNKIAQRMQVAQNSSQDQISNQEQILTPPSLLPSPYANSVISGRSGVNLNQLNQLHRDAATAAAAAKKRGSDRIESLGIASGFGSHTGQNMTLLDVARNMTPPAEKASRREHEEHDMETY